MNIQLITKKLLNQRDAVSYILNKLSNTTSLGATIKVNPFNMNSLKKGFLDSSQKLSETSSNYLIALEKDYTHEINSSFKDWFYDYLTDVKNTK